MKKVLFTIIISFLPIISFAQDNYRILARAGSTTITVDEFRDRYEFMPHLNYTGDELQKEFLYSLLTEKLWALEARKLRLDTIETVNYSLKSLSKLLLKDELYRKEIESKIVISSEEIKDALLKIGKVLKTAYLVSKDSSEIYRLYNSLKSGADFDSLLKVRTGGQPKPIDVKFGEIDKTIENIFFSLKPGEFSQPYRTDLGWFIVHVEGEESDITIDPSSDKVRNIAISVLKERKSKAAASEYWDKIFAGRKVNAKRNILEAFADSLFSILNYTYANAKTAGENITINDLVLTKVLKIFSEDEISTLPFVEFDSDYAVLKDFIYYLVYSKINFRELTNTNVRVVLSKALKNFIENEILYREAISLGLDNIPSFRKDINIWTDYYLSEVLMQKMTDNLSFNQPEINEVDFQTSPDSILQANIIEILTDNLNEVEIILSELHNGKSFEELAAEYNQRELTKKSGGEWGYFPVNKGGEIGRAASKMETGQIYGPIKMPEGYSLFKLLDKRAITVKNQSEETENPKLVQIQTKLTKLNSLINQKTVELADKYGIEINEKLLMSIELSEVNMFTYRLIGFGGKIAALPITIPMFEWYKFFKGRKEIP
jgi:parvulin-like peptidyl-prolyl isomerase